MTDQIVRIKLNLPMGMGSVNCYLVRVEGGFILIDTGTSTKRRELVRQVEDAGCKPGMLNLILLTHGDFDHSGNAAYLKSLYRAKIAMHQADAGMGEHGDMFENRKKPNALIRAMVPLFTGFGKKERFGTDTFLGDDQGLTEYGWDARVLSLPGHSRGSIGVLTASGDLFCGDLFDNTKTPALNSIMDDVDSARASMARLNTLGIKTVYPGHGDPFAYNLFL